MTLFKKNSLLLIVFLVFNTLFSQTIPSKNITVQDGLPSNNIKCFYKDSRGVMWIGTEGGLCCYDGTTFKIYNETNGLKSDEIRSIVEDKNKNLWLSSYGNGLAKFDGKKFTYYDKQDGLINNCIRTIHYSKKHNCLLLGTENGLSLFDGKTFKSFVFKTLIPENIVSKCQISGIDETNREILVTVSYGDVYRLTIPSDLKKTTFTKCFSPTLLTYSSFINHEMYYGGGHSRFLFQRNLKTNAETQIPCALIWDFAKDDNQAIYAATWNVTDPNGGLYKYQNNQLTNITQQANIQSTGLWCLYYDKATQQLWVGSIDKGIYLVDLSRRIKNFSAPYFGLKQLEIQAVHHDPNNNLWIGAKNKIIVVSKDSRYIVFDSTKLKEKILKNYIQPNYSYPYSRKSFSCVNITTDKQGYTWVATTMGLFCFDKKLNLHEYISTEESHIIFDKNDQLFLAVTYANIFLNQQKFDFKNYKQFSIKENNIAINVTKLVSYNNDIWFGCLFSGLFRLHNNVIYSLNSQKQFHEKNIKELMVNDRGALVIGTNSGNVYICQWDNQRLKILQHYKPGKNLYGNSISFIEESNGYYFIGTNKGINVLKNHQFVKLINQSDGITDTQFNDCSKDQNGNLWVATNSGLVFLNVKEIIGKLNTASDIKINSIKVNGIDYSKKRNSLHWGSYTNKELKLNYDENDIEIYFKNYNLYNADKNVYRYKIIGLSKNWSEYDGATKIQLRGVPNGKYQLVISGKNTGTGTVFKDRNLTLIISPPFWKTTWFIISSILGVFILGFIFYKQRVKWITSKEKAKSEVQKRLAETKMEALQSQMNPHFIFNAMNSIQNFIIRNNVDEALMYMGEFSKLMRQTLNNSSELKISLETEIEYLNIYIKLENMRFKEAVNFSINVPEELDPFEIEIPPMVLQPFIENVFVHAFDSKTNNPKLELNFKLETPYLICEIKDNGKGISPDNLNKLHASKGIKLVKERLHLLQAHIADPVTIISNPESGTTVILKLEIHP